jgi:hypothetical protein
MGGIIMKKMNHVLLSVVIILALSACTSYRYTPSDITGEVVREPNLQGEDANYTELPAEDDEDEEAIDAPQEEVEESKEADIIATEGDLISLAPYVMDPDGDEIELGFTLPFDENGMWQTSVGDAGFYSIIVTATDNKGSLVTKQKTIRVLVKNKPPVIEIADVLEFNEGDLIIINAKITDPDDPEVFVTYSGWMTSKMYQTTYDDAGTYTVTITADDGTNRVKKDVTIIVHEVNRKPVVSFETKKITVTEGELVEIKVSASDPDGDDITVTFSEPLDEDGKWQTEKGDEGRYTFTVSVTDGENVVEEEVSVEVLRKNTPPVIQSITVTPEEVVLKKPGDTVTIKITVIATDADDDELVITYSGFMDSAEKTVRYGEPGGLKTVKITVSDGKDSVSQEVTFNMNNWPCFDCN